MATIAVKRIAGLEFLVAQPGTWAARCRSAKFIQSGMRSVSAFVEILRALGGAGVRAGLGREPLSFRGPGEDIEDGLGLKRGEPSAFFAVDDADVVDDGRGFQHGWHVAMVCRV